MKLVARYVNSVESKSGKTYHRFAVVPTGDSVSVGNDYCSILPETGKSYLIDVQARAILRDGEPSPFLATSLLCEVNQ